MMSSPLLQLLTVFCSSAKGTSNDAEATLGPVVPGARGRGIEIRGGQSDPAVGVSLHEDAAEDRQGGAFGDDFGEARERRFQFGDGQCDWIHRIPFFWM